MRRDADILTPGGVYVIKNMCVRAHINGWHMKCVRPWGHVRGPRYFGRAPCGTLHMPQDTELWDVHGGAKKVVSSAGRT